MKCYKAYNQFIEMITEKGTEDIYRQKIGLSVNSITLEIEYGVAEITVDPNDPEVVEERLIN